MKPSHLPPLCVVQSLSKVLIKQTLLHPCVAAPVPIIIHQHPEHPRENAGGDPYIAELWRRVGGLGMLRGIHVTNAVGGVQRSGQAYQPPRYERSTVPQLAMQALLSDSTLKLRQRIRDAIHFPPVSVSVRPVSGGMAACHDAPCASPAATACCAAQPVAADSGAAQAGQTRGPLAPGQGADCTVAANAVWCAAQGRGAGEQLPPEEVLRQLQPDALSQVGTCTADAPQQRRLEHPGDGTTGQQGVAACYPYAAQCAAQGGVTAMGPLPPEEADAHNRSSSWLGGNPAVAEAQGVAQDREAGGPLPPEEVLRQLQPNGLSLDVLVPCYRLDPAVLTVMEQRVRCAGAALVLGKGSSKGQATSLGHIPALKLLYSREPAELISMSQLMTPPPLIPLLLTPLQELHPPLPDSHLPQADHRRGQASAQRIGAGLHGRPAAQAAASGTHQVRGVATNVGGATLLVSPTHRNWIS